MLTTIDELKRQLFIPVEDNDEDHQLERIIRSVSEAIETYCRRAFSSEYTLPGEEPSEVIPRLPYDVEDACILWCTYRINTGGNMGVSSERIDGLGQKNYALQHIDGKVIPAPPSVLALIDPYRNMVYG
ncbi:head-tail connector protein [Sporosarcina newyorkensis]|uniref:Phage gp6-like head-tail connector protein n=1 Tax=Sporosarcina newyorkensis TaxID=759851 RepID=A0A1T4YV06_9BACL|nr:head-tail connector protein [Sporosarcina newyorkensis]SKB05121.1 Phage gp6-like head-tail connector protein [Sporosarcina newyorkensis]